MAVRLLSMAATRRGEAGPRCQKNAQNLWPVSVVSMFMLRETAENGCSVAGISSHKGATPDPIYITHTTHDSHLFTHRHNPGPSSSTSRAKNRCEALGGCGHDFSSSEGGRGAFGC